MCHANIYFQSCLAYLASCMPCQLKSVVELSDQNRKWPFVMFVLPWMTLIFSIDFRDCKVAKETSICLQFLILRVFFFYTNDLEEWISSATRTNETIFPASCWTIFKGLHVAWISSYRCVCQSILILLIFCGMFSSFILCVKLIFVRVS